MTLLELMKLLRKHLKLVIALPVVCALATAAFAWLMLPDTYTVSVSMYVLTRADDSDTSLTNTDLSASQMLTNDVAELIASTRVLSDTADSLGMSNLDGYDIDVTSSTSTRVITVSVTSESASSVAIVANGLAETTDDVAREIMEVESVNVIDHASEPTSPSGPPRLLYAAVAFLIGLFLAGVIVVLRDMLNTRVRTPEEIEELLNVPVIGRIPVIKG